MRVSVSRDFFLSNVTQSEQTPVLRPLINRRLLSLKFLLQRQQVKKIPRFLIVLNTVGSVVITCRERKFFNVVRLVEVSSCFEQLKSDFFNCCVFSESLRIAILNNFINVLNVIEINSSGRALPIRACSITNLPRSNFIFAIEIASESTHINFGLSSMAVCG